MKKSIAVGIAAWLSGTLACAQVETDIRRSNGPVSAIVMGAGEHAVIALHGSDNDRNFFFLGKGGQMGRKLANAGFRVIAVTWSGRAGGFNEVDAAIAHAREAGAKKISLMGHSRGGELAANYALGQPDGTLDTVIQFSSADDHGLPMTLTKKLFVFNKYDRVAAWQPAAYGKSAPPKQMIELGGSGHPVSALIGEKSDLVRDVVMLLRQ
jgi:alpha-beta hydrolase superfamily lysophospholipase